MAALLTTPKSLPAVPTQHQLPVMVWLEIYKYEQAAYNESGEEKIVKMNEHRSKPLREGAYLKLLVNPRKGVLSWEEVSQEDVPKPALDQLNNK